MIVRALTFAGGLAGAASFSQFPEFSQQYVQRLGGAVDALERVVADFDQDAADVSLSREAALVDLASGGQMGRERADTMVRTIDRHKALSADLDALQAAGPFTRAAQAARFRDSEIAQRAFQNFKPAAPLTFEGATFAGAGFVSGLAVFGLLFWLIAWPFRRRRKGAVQQVPSSPAQNIS